MSRYSRQSTLPPFEPVTLAELRQLWTLYPPEHDVRRLILEVQRYRLLLKEIDGLYETTHKAWRNSVGGNLVALHQLQGVMFNERFRIV